MALTKEQSLKIIKIAERRQSVIAAIRASCFQNQLDFIDDRAKLKVAQCTRRAGKSYAAGAYLTTECLAHPNSTCLYIATTRAQAMRVVLKDILNVINKKFQIGMMVNKTHLSVTFPNGSVIYILGLDSKPEEMEKALGQKYRLIMIDEGGSWRQDQKHMVHSVLEPACADLEGTICLIGSPVASLRTYFYDICGRNFLDPKRPPEAKQWSIHRWSWKDNPHINVNMQKQIDRMVALNPLVLETPAYRQMYLNQWVVDLSARVYKFDDVKNTIDQLPTHHRYYYGLGLDLGFEDDTSITISAYSDHDPNMYFVEVFKKKGMDLTDVANQLDQFKARYNPYKWVVDGASKQAVQELRNRFGFPLEAADKQGKADMIEIMNNDFIMGRIKLVMPGCEQLAEEYENLIWDEKSTPGKKIENSACPNHAADGALYSWRMCYHFRAKDREKEIIPGSEEALELWWDNEALRAQKIKGQDWVKQEFGKDYEGYH